MKRNKKCTNLSKAQIKLFQTIFNSSITYKEIRRKWLDARMPSININRARARFAIKYGMKFKPLKGRFPRFAHLDIAKLKKLAAQ